MVDQAESDAEDDVRAGEGQPTTRATQAIALTKQAPDEVKRSPTPGTATALPGTDLLSLLIVVPSLRLRPPPRFSLSPPCLAWLATRPRLKAHFTSKITLPGTLSHRHLSLRKRPRRPQETASPQRRRNGQSPARLFCLACLPMVRATADLPMQMSSSPSPPTPAPAPMSTLSLSIS